jgi:putative transcriptional regulator
MNGKAMMEFRLRVVMAEKNISNKKLASLTGLAYGTISKLKTSTPTRIEVETMDKLCAALKCQPGDLWRYMPDNNAA